MVAFSVQTGQRTVFGSAGMAEDAASIKDAWPDAVWKFISPIFSELQTQRPKKQEDGTVGGHYGGSKVCQVLSSVGELRNITCNLTWIPPLQFSPTCSNVPIGLVKKFASRMWMNSDGDIDCPSVWPRGHNIPVAVFSKVDEPKKGEMQRYGLDLTVLSFWWVLAAAVQANQDEQVGKLKQLALDVQFDFKYFQNETEAFWASANLLESNELQREFQGLDTEKMTDIVARVKALLQTEGVKADAEAIAQRLRVQIQWSDSKRIPSCETVEHHLQIAAYVTKSEQASLALQIARLKYGRQTIFDEHTKLLLCVQRSQSLAEFGFLIEGLLALTVRSQNMDRPSLSELKSKTGPISTLQFLRKYFRYLLARQGSARSCSKFCRRFVFLGTWSDGFLCIAQPEEIVKNLVSKGLTGDTSWDT